MKHLPHLVALRAFMTEDLEDRGVDLDEGVHDIGDAFEIDDDGRTVGLELNVRLSDGRIFRYRLGVKETPALEPTT